MIDTVSPGNSGPAWAPVKPNLGRSPTKDHYSRLKPPAVEMQRLVDDGAIPNHPELPLLVYRQAVTLPEDDPATTFEAIFNANGWPAGWRNSIYPFHHFHSTAHEVLGVYAGADPGIVGAYPAGTSPDLCRGAPDERPACQP